MGKTKVECKKLDYLTETQKCVFCGTSEIDEMKYGPVYVHKNIITHYYCLLLSSNMEQNGRDCDGILGFLPSDISREVKRGFRLNCSYCRTNGATLGCAISKCKVVFHLPCGMKHSTLHQFFGQFKSFCNKHRPVQNISEKILANSSKGAMCGICYEKVVPRPVHETLWAPCCQKNAFFHRDCVQKLAVSAGYFFKCPLCNNTTLFQQTMKEFGIYIPEQDASWESVPHAYQDLLVRHDSCDSPNCSCPEGRKTNVPGTRWELILCKYCGSQGIHIGCGRLTWKCPQFECDICSSTAPQSNEDDTRNSNGNRHRLSATRTANIHPSVSADREINVTNSDESSDNSMPLVSNRRMRICSPPPALKPQTPPLRTSRKKHRREKYEKTLQANTIVVDDDEDNEEKNINSFILIDDSDDDVELVPEEKFSFNQSTGTSLKTIDGMTIPVVQVDGQTESLGMKRLRAVGDVVVDPPDVVDINFQMPNPVKKPKVPSPPQITEVVFSLPQNHAQPSTSQSVPSTSFAPPDFNRFVLVDSSTLRPEELLPGTVLYRSVQPMVQPQSQPQTNVPLQQQLGASCHADAQHSDLSKYWTGGSNHFSLNSNTHLLQKSTKKAPRRSIKCDSVGRRRGEYSRCDNVGLNPRVMISRLRSRISQNGHVEFFVPWLDVSCFGPLKRKSMLLSRPMKKMKLVRNKCASKQKMIDNGSSALPNSNVSDNPQKKISKSKRKSSSNKPFKVKLPFNTKPIITDYYCPSKARIDRKIKKKPTDGSNLINNNKNDSKNEKIFTTTESNMSQENKRKRSKEKSSVFPENKRFKTMDSFLKKIEHPSTSQIGILNQHSPDNVNNKEQKQLGFVSVKTVMDDITSAAIKTPLENLSVLNVPLPTRFLDSVIIDENHPGFSSKCPFIPSEDVLLPDKKKHVLSFLEERASVEPHVPVHVEPHRSEVSDCNVKVSDPVGFKNSNYKNPLIPNVACDKTLSSSLPEFTKNSMIQLENDILVGERKSVLVLHDIKENYLNITQQYDENIDTIASASDVSSDITNHYQDLINDDNQPLLSLPESSYNRYMIPLENEISLVEKGSMKTVLGLERRHNENDSTLSHYCDNYASKKDIVTLNCKVSKLNNDNDVKKYGTVDLDKDMTTSLKLNVIDLLNTFSDDLEQDIIKSSIGNQKFDSKDRKLVHEDSVINLMDGYKHVIQNVLLMKIHSSIDGSPNKNSCSVTNNYEEQSCPDKSQEKITAIKETVFTKYSSDANISDNCQKHDNRIQGFFPKIKFIKNIKTRTKQLNSSVMKTNGLYDCKSAKKSHMENNSKNRSHQKVYNIEHYFAPKNKNGSSGYLSIFNSETTTSRNTCEEEENNIGFPILSSQANNIFSNTKKSDKKPLHEMKLNTMS